MVLVVLVSDGFCPCFGDNGMLWLQLAGGLPNINALSLYTYLEFIVTSLDGDKAPIMLLQHDAAGLAGDSNRGLEPPWKPPNKPPQ